MQYFRPLRATVLIYTMVLVVIGVFMATVVLNIAVQLSVDFQARDIEISLWETVRDKWNISMQYVNTMNNSGSWFLDEISCPTWITMSGAILRTTWINTQIRYIDNTITCLAQSAHWGNDLDIIFNENFDDIEFAQYEWDQISVNSGNLIWVFSDSDTTQITIPNTSYFSSDGIDDNFDSDNFSISSTWSIFYPDWYTDNDRDASLLYYGYIWEETWPYNVFWSNTKLKQYIDNNPNNINNVYQTLWSTWLWYVYININGDHIISLYTLDKDRYDDFNELVITDMIQWASQPWWEWYLQWDLSLAAGTWSAFSFDFTNNDYALFIENTGSWTQLYQVSSEDSVTGSWVYINPIDDSDDTMLSYLWSHILINDEGRLIWDIFEVFWLK